MFSVDSLFFGVKNMTIQSSTSSCFKQLDNPSQLSQFNRQIVACKEVPRTQIVNEVAKVYIAYIQEAQSKEGDGIGYFIERLVKSPTLSNEDECTQIDNFDLHSNSFPSKDCKKFKELHVRPLSLKELKELNDAKEEYSFSFSEHFQPGITSSLIQGHYLKASQIPIKKTPTPTSITDLINPND